MNKRLQHVFSAFAAFFVVALTIYAVSGSSHREAPFISQDPAVDGTDVYAFVDPKDPSKVNLIVNYYPVQEPNGGPNFYRFADNAFYFIHVDNDGDAMADISYEFQFLTSYRNPDTFLYNTGPITSINDQDLNVRQMYKVSKVVHGPQGRTYSSLGSRLLVPPVNIGPKSTPDYEDLAAAAVYKIGDDIKVFAGQRDDPFFVDLGAVFDLLTIRKLPGNAGGGVDGLGGFNVNTIALQIPIDKLVDEDDVIGVWTTSRRPQERVLQHDGTPPELSGEGVQVSRLGMPLVNELVVPLGKKDAFNASYPSGDAAFLSLVTSPEPARLLNLLYGDILADVPETNRQDLVAVFLTGIPGLNQPKNIKPSEMLRLNTSVEPADKPERLGAIAGDLSGFPNGRRLSDDVVDVTLRAAACGYGDILAGKLGLCNLSPNNLLGDGVDANDVKFLDSFPYVGTPHSGFMHQHHSAQTTAAVSAGVGASLMGLGAIGYLLNRRRRPVGQP
jgi:hypothetical protein